MASLKQAAKTIFRECLALRKGENVLILIDRDYRKIGDMLLKEAISMTENVIQITVPVGKVSGDEPPPDAAKAMRESDVVVAVTTKSVSHTDARRAASAAGARIITMPGITEDIMRRCIAVDYRKMNQLGIRLGKILDDGDIVEIRTDLGTRITLSIKGRKSVHFCGTHHNRGDFSNLPDGEVCVAPVEESASGVFVVDSSMSGKVIEPLRITVRDGYAVSIEGGKKGAELYRELVSLNNKAAFHIGEMGIGINEKAVISGNTLEDEKVIGTAHLALGDNTSYPGGVMNAPCHIDGVFTKPTIKVDDTLVMKDGKIVD